MKIHYLEVVTPDVDAVCCTYEKTQGAVFGQPVAGLGNARTSILTDGSMVGIRAPMSETEEPIIRPYWLVDDLDKALSAAEKSGGEIAHPAMEIPGYGQFAIYLLGGINHGLWQL